MVICDKQSFTLKTDIFFMSWTFDLIKFFLYVNPENQSRNACVRIYASPSLLIPVLSGSVGNETSDKMEV